MRWPTTIAATCDFLKKDYDRAIADYDQAIRVDPLPGVAADDRGRTGTNVYNNRGYAYFAKKDYARAIADYDRAIKVDPEDPAGLQQSRPRLFRHEGLTTAPSPTSARRSSSIRTMPSRSTIAASPITPSATTTVPSPTSAQAIRLDPKYAEAFYNRGSAYAEKRTAMTAPSPITTAPSALNAEIRLRLRQSRRGSMRTRATSTARSRDYSESLRLDPTNANDFNRRGVAYYGKKDYDRAIADYDQAIKLNPAYAAALINRGNAWRAKGMQRPRRRRLRPSGAHRSRQCARLHQPRGRVRDPEAARPRHRRLRSR